MMAALKKRTREFAWRAGGLSVIRALGRNSVRILLYHRFSDQSKPLLQKQCAHLRRHYNVVSLDDIDRWLLDGAPLPPNSLAVTVDDGYRDFYFNAYPIFASYGIPVTIFLTTDFLDRKSWLWVDQLAYVIEHTPDAAAEIPLPQGSYACTLRSPVERLSALTTIKAAVKRMPHSARMRFVTDELPKLLSVTLPDKPPSVSEPMLWDEARQMNKNGIYFGAHTLTHPILSSLETEQELRYEIVGSKNRIEEELGRPVQHFSYPNGTRWDIDPQTIQVVKDAGFRSAVVAEGGVNNRSADAYLLRRNTVEPSASEIWYGRYVTGFRRD